MNIHTRQLYFCREHVVVPKHALHCATSEDQSHCTADAAHGKLNVYLFKYYRNLAPTSSQIEHSNT